MPTLEGKGRSLLVLQPRDDAAAYEGWRTHPVRATFNADMERLLESEPASAIQGGVYTVAVSATRS